LLDIVDDQRRVPLADGERELLCRAARFACEAALPMPPGAGRPAEVSLRLVDDAEIRRLNKAFRGVDRATDVLSFPLGDSAPERDPQTGNALLGDIAVSLERARDQAREYGHSYQRELAFLFVHGLLHLFGYDHETDADARAMEEMQERVLAELGMQRQPGGAGAAEGAAAAEGGSGAGAAEGTAAAEGGTGADAAEGGSGASAAEGTAAAEGAGHPMAGTFPRGYKSGFAGIMGKPNVGKSTLLNRLMGERLSIVSSKPQTTRRNIKAILSSEGCQIVFVDTPGAHMPKSKLDEHMMRSVRTAARDVDVALLLIDAREADIGTSDMETLRIAGAARTPAILLINKSDLVQKDKLLPLISRVSARFEFAAIIPISAKTGDGADAVISEIRRLLPEGPPLYPQDAITDQIERQIAADIVREKSLLLLDKEVPHGIEVEVERFAPNAKGTVLEIYAVMYCEKESHKKIIIGKNGESLKKIGASARLDLEREFGSKVFLSLWVKLKKDWRDDSAMLRQFGYGSDARG
jgi:GTP-binding protein Era